MSEFKGFDKEFVDFLVQLSFNNTLEKQSDNITGYKKYITQPLTALYYELLPIACEINYMLETKPSRCISTPYTDRRFSPSVPLKEYMYLRFKQSGKSKDIAGIYFDMSFDGYSYGLRIYKQSSSGFQRLKDAIIDNPDKFEKELIGIVDFGYKIVGEKYKKDHYPEIKSDTLNDFLNRKTFYFSKNMPINERIFSNELLTELSEGFYQLADMMNLIVSAAM